jgi:hypothetical protein
MAAELDSPKTGLIAWITALSLILLFVAFVSLQGLFNLWELRHDQRAGLGTLETPLTAYKKEQFAKLDKLDAAKGSTLKDAADGKVLAAPPPPAPPAKTETPAPTK